MNICTMYVLWYKYVLFDTQMQHMIHYVVHRCDTQLDLSVNKERFCPK